MTIDRLPDAARRLVRKYLQRLDLSIDELWITVDRNEFQRWLGRRVSASIGGAYVYLLRQPRHAVLINMDRIDLDQLRALEIVVAEELVHMRDWIDGDRRGHSHHGYDRIAARVVEHTGATIEEVRSPLLPVTRRPWRYVYGCAACGLRAPRRRKGRWSCPRCAPRFAARYELEIVEYLGPGGH
ncbi:hypothetical protein BH23CHL3_BH23CHL3_11860 [soil metagenome]